MLRTVCLIAAVMAFAVPFVAQETKESERWVLGATTETGHRIYYRHLVRSGALVTFSQASVTRDGERSYSEARVDCKKAMVSFRAPTEKGSDPSPWGEWMDVFPGSAGDDLMKVVCAPPDPNDVKRPQ